MHNINGINILNLSYSFGGKKKFDCKQKFGLKQR